jgi:hypothetical protein
MLRRASDTRENRIPLGGLQWNDPELRQNEKFPCHSSAGECLLASIPLRNLRPTRVQLFLND